MIKLSARLQAVADMVSQDATVADIGCDHGYIPAYLAQNKISNRIIAGDINEGPLNSCKRLVKDLNLEDKIQCVLSNGLIDIPQVYDTVIIAGMGGELISDILSQCDYVKQCRLVLNPMSHSELVRKWLYDNGYSILNDAVVTDGKHSYNVLLAEYTDTKQERDIVDYFLGEINNFSDKNYFIHLRNYLINKQKSGADYSKVIRAIEEIL